MNAWRNTAEPFLSRSGLSESMLIFARNYVLRLTVMSVYGLLIFLFLFNKFINKLCFTSVDNISIFGQWCLAGLFLPYDYFQKAAFSIL